MRFPPGEANAHMPFHFRRNGAVEALYCQSSSRVRVRNGKFVEARPTAWKLVWSSPNAEFARALPTGLPEDADECSPALSIAADGEIQVSFIGQLSKHDHRMRANRSGARIPHRLFIMRGPDLDRLSAAVAYSDEQCYCGFARPDLAVLSDDIDGSARIVGSRYSVMKTSFASLARISYCFDEPFRLLVTGRRKDGRSYETVSLDLNSGKLLGELRVGGQSCYKPSVLAGEVVLPVPPGASHLWQLQAGMPVEYVDTEVTIELD